MNKFAAMIFSLFLLVLSGAAGEQGKKVNRNFGRIVDLRKPRDFSQVSEPVQSFLHLF